MQKSGWPGTSSLRSQAAFRRLRRWQWRPFGTALRRRRRMRLRTHSLPTDVLCRRCKRVPPPLLFLILWRASWSSSWCARVTNMTSGGQNCLFGKSVFRTEVARDSDSMALQLCVMWSKYTRIYFMSYSTPQSLLHFKDPPTGVCKEAFARQI